MFRNEFLDKDVLSLQISASIIETNWFLINALIRFGLFEYLTK